MFTVCVSLVLHNKYVQFRIISSLPFNIIVDIFEVDLRLTQYGKRLVNPLISEIHSCKLKNIKELVHWSASVHCNLLPANFRAVNLLNGKREGISLSHAMRPGLQIRHFWVAKSLFLTITFNQKKQDETFCF